METRHGYRNACCLFHAAFFFWLGLGNLVEELCLSKNVYRLMVVKLEQPSLDLSLLEFRDTSLENIVLGPDDLFNNST
jgi:hypothetical protein